MTNEQEDLQKQKKVGDTVTVAGGIASWAFLALFLFTAFSDGAAGLSAAAFWVSLGLVVLGLSIMSVGMLMTNMAKTGMDLLAWNEWQEEQKP